MTLEQQLQYQFARSELLEQALTHKSYHNENRENSVGHNERLEFLGDAVIDLCLSQYLMEKFPDFQEGELSKLRASLVNENTLAEMAGGFQFDELLKLGKGEIRSGGAKKPRLLASAFEAVVGSVFLDAGYYPAQALVVRLFTPYLDDDRVRTLYSSDYKTRLQESLQQQLQMTPEYSVIDESGPDHQKMFVAQVRVGDRVLATGSGNSKKSAEQAAACEALKVVV